jgi:hypothetical protein
MKVEHFGIGIVHMLAAGGCVLQFCNCVVRMWSLTVR